MPSLPNLNEIGKDKCPSTNLHNWHEVRPEPNASSEPSTSKGPNGRFKIVYRESERRPRPLQRRQIMPPSNWITFEKLVVQETEASTSPQLPTDRNGVRSIKRQESYSSSIGATSTRRLINLVLPAPIRPAPQYNRIVLRRYFFIFCLTHLIHHSTIIPFIVLQASTSVWILPFHDFFPVSINIGSSLLAFTYSLAAVSALIGPHATLRLGTNVIFMSSYAVFAFFYIAHLYPSLYLLVPVYGILGLTIGQLTLCSMEFLMRLANKMNDDASDIDDNEMALMKKRTVTVRRLARVMKASQDLGLIFGSMVTAIIVSYRIKTVSNPLLHNKCYNSTTLLNFTDCDPQNPCASFLFNNVSATVIIPNINHNHNCTVFNVIDSNSFLDYFFDMDEHGQRLCGASAEASSNAFTSFSTPFDYAFATLPHKTSGMLTLIYFGFSLIAILISGLGLRKLKLFGPYRAIQDSPFITSFTAVVASFKDVKLQSAAPLSVFTGMMQGFIYSDFSKSYVLCSLGIEHLHLVFLCKGVLQCVAACTLSMLLKSIERYYVVCVGLIFQCCVLMVLILWKPVNDDPALFYVIPVVWGACNAIWEVLMFSLITTLYSDNWQAAFSNTIFFKFLGLSIAFTFHAYFPNWIKLYGLCVFMICSIFPFLMLEIRLTKSRIKNNGRLN